ncbi:MAG: UDP-N-acetylmuramate--L-alanine ligase [Acidobacteriota bacterium]
MKFRKAHNIHFIGIGGIGMSGIAEVLLNLNYAVTGSDITFSPIIKRLRKLGGKIAIGHRETNIKNPDVVVVSSAIDSDNIEVREAIRRKIPVIPRAEMLAELMRMKYGIAIAGSHGKTSTTSMVATILSRCGFDPTIVIGGKLGILRSSAKLGKGDFLVAEADESDGSFLKLSPIIAIVTNIDKEHLDYYMNLDEIMNAFVRFLNRIPFYGVGIICLDDRNIQKIMPRLDRKIVTYGFNEKADLHACNLTFDQFQSAYTAYLRGKKLGKVTLRVPGRHSILNSLAALAVGLEFDIEFKKIAKVLGAFRGAERRFHLRGEIDSIMVVDDYGHHPTEIISTLATAKQGWNRRLVTVFQPHRYTRVSALMDEFAHSFKHTDFLIVTEIYPAGEKPIQGVTGELLADRIRRESSHLKDVVYIKKPEEIPPYLMKVVQKKDMVITLGAGNVWRVGDAFLKLLAQHKKED